jgi:exopolysaccharide biosynthesis polyprenyl glycosylphosphotransferase
MGYIRSKGFRLLHIIDAVTLFGLMVIIAVARFGFDWPTYPLSHYLIGFGFVTIIHLVVFYFGGFYQYEQRLGAPTILPTATILTGTAVLISSAITLATGRYLMPRFNLTALFVLGTGTVTIMRLVARRLRYRRFGSPRVLLVGNSDDASLAAKHLAESGHGITVAGQLDDVADVFGAVDESDSSDVLLLSGEPLDAIYPHPLEEFEVLKIGVYRRITPADTLLGLQRSRQIAGMPFVALRTHAVAPHRLRLKRLFDLIVLAVLSPMILLVVGAVAVYTRALAGRGVLFHQTRVGRHSKLFTLVKFRTMQHDAEAAGAQLATEGDQRVVPGMGWLRLTRLDELPQLWNVLKGEMSIVGPRPERPEFVSRFEETLPGYSRRHDISPGITGLAQIRAHYQTDAEYKLGHDLQYIVNWSPVLDLSIMAETVVVMLGRTAR